MPWYDAPLPWRPFEQAFTANRVLRFDYVDREGHASRRRVEPHGLLVRAPLWYIIASDLDKDAARIFRMDRVRQPLVQTDVNFLPRPIELVMEVCPDARATPESPSRNRGFTSARVSPPPPVDPEHAKLLPTPAR